MTMRPYRPEDRAWVLTLAGRLLVKMVAVHHGLSREQEDGLHDSLRSLIKELSPVGGV